MIKILIADDHAIIREGLKQIMADTSDMVVAGEAADGNQVLELLDKDDWNVILLDIGLPGRGGLDILKQLKRERPEIPVLILSIYPEEQYAVRALKAGAAGYLTKESAPDELIAATRRVISGRKYISASLAEKLAVDLADDHDKLPHETLSDREYQVMCLIAGGMTVTEIAERLFLSGKTISTYRTRLLEKMGMKTNAELTRYAILHGLVD